MCWGCAGCASALRPPAPPKPTPMGRGSCLGRPACQTVRGGPSRVPLGVCRNAAALFSLARHGEQALRPLPRESIRRGGRGVMGRVWNPKIWCTRNGQTDRFFSHDGHFGLGGRLHRGGVTLPPSCGVRPLPPPCACSKCWGVAEGGWRVTDGGWRVTDGGWRVTDGGWGGNRRRLGG